jgi:hypothetical protein
VGTVSWTKVTSSCCTWLMSLLTWSRKSCLASQGMIWEQNYKTNNYLLITTYLQSKCMQGVKTQVGWTYRCSLEVLWKHYDELILTTFVTTISAWIYLLHDIQGWSLFNKRSLFNQNSIKWYAHGQIKTCLITLDKQSPGMELVRQVGCKWFVFGHITPLTNTIAKSLTRLMPQHFNHHPLQQNRTPWVIFKLEKVKYL